MFCEYGVTKRKLCNDNAVYKCGHCGKFLCKRHGEWYHFHKKPIDLIDLKTLSGVI